MFGLESSQNESPTSEINVQIDNQDNQPFGPITLQTLSAWIINNYFPKIRELEPIKLFMEKHGFCFCFILNL